MARAPFFRISLKDRLAGERSEHSEHRPGDERHNVWASLACHSVARAGDPLAAAEMNVLLERLQRCANPMHCPHGRPTIVRLEPEAIARLFKR